MDDNKVTPKSNNDSSKPTYLSSENPDVLKNLDIKTNVSDAKPSAIESTTNTLGYTSPYSSPQQPQIPQQPQQGMTDVNAPVYNPSEAHPAGQMGSPFGQNYQAGKYQLPTQNPLQSQQEVIYRDSNEKKSKGGGAVGGVFKQIFSCFGCALFLIALIIAVGAYLLNF